MELGDDAEREQARRECTEQTARLGGLLAFLAKQLEGRVREVRVSGRLTVSPVCLASGETDLSPQMERIMLAGGGPRHRRILEVNPKHVVIERMLERYVCDGADPLLAVGAEMLFGLAQLAEGSPLSDPAGFGAQLTDLLGGALEARA